MTPSAFLTAPTSRSRSSARVGPRWSTLLFHGLLGLMEASGGHPVPVGGVGSQAVERVVGMVVELPSGPLGVADPSLFLGPTKALFHARVGPGGSRRCLPAPHCHDQEDDDGRQHPDQ